MTDIDDLLDSRHNTHGEFEIDAQYAQQLKQIIYNCGNWPLMSAVQREALGVICSKIARIMAGDPHFKDHWDDIAGYAKLVSIDLQRLSKN